MTAIRKQVTREVVALDAERPMREAAKLMDERRIGSVAVRDGNQLLGLVTERDLMLAVCARGADASRPVREAVRTGIPRVHPSTAESEVASLMRDHTTRHLLVEEGGTSSGSSR